MKNKRKSIFKRVISIISVVFFISAFLLLIFATFSLKNDNMSMFGCYFYYVTTNSMEPDIKTGSFIIAKETEADKLNVGDVISFVSSDPDISGLINTHNIHEINTNDNGELVFTTMGSNNPYPDEYPVYAQDIRGKLIFKSYAIGRIFNILSKRWVSFSITVVPILVIVFINFVDLVKIINFFPDDDKKENEKNSD